MSKSAKLIRLILDSEGLKRREYGCLMFDLPPILAKTVVTWTSSHVPDDCIYQDELLHLGLEHRPHVTVKFGFVATSPTAKMREIASQTPPFLIRLGRVSLFKTNPNYDVVILPVSSRELVALNRKLCAIPNKDKFPTYNPHCTLAYVLPGTCDHLVGARVMPDGLDVFLAEKLRFTGKSEDEIKLKKTG